MSRAVHGRFDGVPCPRAAETKPQSLASLLVYIRHDARHCIASFIGSVTNATRSTIDGVADLISAEQSVVLDLSRVEMVDESGADAVRMLVNRVRACGGRFQMAETDGRMFASLRPPTIDSGTFPPSSARSWTSHGAQGDSTR